MLRLRNASALVSEQWVSASQVQVSIFLPHYADDVLCKFLMELLSTSDLIFTQGAELLKSYLQPECISTLNIYSNSFMKSRRKKHPKAIDNNKEMHCASFYWWFSYWVWVTNYGSSWRRGRHQAPGARRELEMESSYWKHNGGGFYVRLQVNNCPGMEEWKYN